VSIIIPFKDKADVLKVCIESILKKSTWENYEILLVDNQSEELETKEYLEQLKYNKKIKLLSYDHPFNFAAINNFAVQKAQGEYFLLLNNDTEVISEDWIQSMLEHAQREEVGAVGAKLIYPNNLIQHAGVIVGLNGIANHAFGKTHRNDLAYFGQAEVIRNYSAVTGACMMIRKDIYEKVGGLNEKDLAITFNDIDFCLRLREQGYLVVYTPFAELYHHESLSRGYEVAMKEIQYMKRKYAGILEKGDPYYNRNLTQERFDFSLRVEDKIAD
ncbi:MAG TPA: glycosyltransferase family 2 protein, partial [Candidatus Gracilibacteria bacterium]|nr:glycosyltransferase family 2 protein [Candidatus Gracilibacteria bacterium]